ncbi:MAG: hypothetical protein IKE28_06035 [Solobacterium sp.]|nr:hypothetical protein [Solobacterium sp.]
MSKTVKKVPLHLVHDAIESANEVFDQYLDTKEMKVIMLPNMETGAADFEDGDEELMAQIEDDEENRFYALPSQYDIHEYRIMEAYIDELKDDRLAHELLIAIRGKRAFRRFKDTLIGYGMIQSWYDYEDQYYWKLARRWCIERNLEFTL